MQPMPPSVMIDQVQDYAPLIQDQVRPFDHSARLVFDALELKSIRHVVITGDGDSFHAAHAAELAFENIAGVICEPMSAQRFLDYGADWLKVPFPRGTLVIGVSASGRTERVVQALTRARERGVLTLAVTGNADSPVAHAAERQLIAQLPEFGPSPGLRTFIANLLYLYLLAIRLGEVKDAYHQDVANAMRAELTGLASVADSTVAATVDAARTVSAATKDAQAMAVVGSGPSYGTALFSAAKVVEAAGVLAVGQDLEEWAHVERFAYPIDMPVIIIAPPGRSHWRAIKLAEQAKSLGRRVIAIISADDTEIAAHADWVWPVVGEVREEFSPLIYSIGTSLFSSFLAEDLGRMLFQTDLRTDS